MNEDLRRSFQTDPRASQAIDDASIPVLTEKLSLPAIELDISLPPAAPQPAADPAPSAIASVAIEAVAPASLLADPIATTAREQAIAQWQAELGPALEAAVHTRVAAAVDEALLDMLALLQISLESQIRIAVKEALAQQLAALRAVKPR